MKMNKKHSTTLVLLLMLLILPVAIAQCAGFSDQKYITICEKIVDVGCKILLLIQSIAAGIATVMIILAGYQWIASAGFEDPRRRTEAKERIVHVFIGLVFIMVATQLINYLFGGSLGVVVNC